MPVIRMRVAVLVSGVVNRIADMVADDKKHFGDLLKLAEIEHDTFVYTSLSGWLKYQHKHEIADGQIRGYPIKKLVNENYHYAIIDLDRRQIESTLNQMYDNIREIAYEPEDDDFEKKGHLHHHKFAHKVMKAYQMAKEHEKKHGFTYDVFIYARPDAFMNVNESLAKRLRGYLDEIHRSSDRMVINIRTNIDVTKNNTMTGNASQKMFIATPESAEVFSKMYSQVDGYDHKVYFCKRCSEYSDKYAHNPEVNEVPHCHVCQKSDRLKKTSEIQLEYKIYQHLFTHGVKMIYNVFKIHVFR